MSNETTTQPSVTEAQIKAVMTTISEKLGGGGAFVTPSAIEPILEGMVNENNTLAPIANAVWDIAQRMHMQTGEAVTMVAMQKEMIEEIVKQRNIAIANARAEGYEEGYGEGIEVGFENGLEAGAECAFEDSIDTFYRAVMDNQIVGLTQLHIDIFSDAFYEGRLDDKAKQMLKELIQHVFQTSQEDMSEVEF